MGHWQVTQISKDDPDTIIICRFHSVSEASYSTLILSVSQQCKQASEMAWIGDEAHPLEIQITNGVGQTAIVFLHQHHSDTNDRLVIHGHVDGARHQYVSKSPSNGKTNKSSKFKSKSKMRFHVTAGGMIELRPENPVMEFALVTREGTTIGFSMLQFRISIFSNIKPPPYQVSMA